MKIYFTAASDVGDTTKEHYRKIIGLVRAQNLNVTESLFTDISSISLDDPSDFGDVYNHILKNIDASDILIADISEGSSGVGYQIYHAIYQKMPVILIYSDSKRSNPSVVIRGIKSKKVLSLKYSTFEDLKKSLSSLIVKAIKMTKVRFNLVMENKDYLYLEKTSKKMKITKTRYLNNLIKKTKRNNQV